MQLTYNETTRHSITAIEFALLLTEEGKTKPTKS